jgi:Rap1a immunity proteins
MLLPPPQSPSQPRPCAGWPWAHPGPTPGPNALGGRPIGSRVDLVRNRGGLCANPRKVRRAVSRVLIVTSLLVLSVTGAQAADDSGNEMLPGCKLELTRRETYGEAKLAKPPTGPFAITASYCMGTIATLMEVSPILIAEHRFCVPKGAYYTQGLRIVISSIEAKPQDAHRPFTVLALEGLRSFWPCPRTQ